jgi:16S rRNA (guanine(966)-N(2))-methyltransferase RsmD
MRIIAGKHRSIPLEVPKENTRPSSDRLKESLFNSMFQQTTHQVWLDCYAGSGAIGCEALSRGAAHAVFSDVSKEAISCIQSNLDKIKETEKATVLHKNAQDTISYCEEKGIVVDVVFCDPPYACDISDVLVMITHSNMMATQALLVIEQAASANEYKINENYVKIKERKVGKSIYRVYQLSKKI